MARRIVVAGVLDRRTFTGLDVLELRMHYAGGSATWLRYPARADLADELLAMAQQLHDDREARTSGK